MEGYSSYVQHCLGRYYRRRCRRGIIPEIGKLVAFRSRLGGWFRGRTLAFSDETVNIFYVDFGFTGILKHDDLRELAPRFTRIYELCVKINIFEDATRYDDSYVSVLIRHGKDGWEGTVRDMSQ